MANGLTPNGLLAYNGTKYLVRVDSFKKGEMSLRLEVKDSVKSYEKVPRRVTYNMGNWADFNHIMPKNCSFVDIVSNRGAEEFLKGTGLAKPFVRNNEEVVRANENGDWYPVYQFDEPMLWHLDPAGYGNYNRSYDAASQRMGQRTFQYVFNKGPYVGDDNRADDLQL